MQKTTWTTPGGKSVEMTWEVDTTEIVDADGHKTERQIPVDEQKPRIVNVTIDGRKFDNCWQQTYKGRAAIYLGEVGGRSAYVGLPSEIKEQVWGEYDRRLEAAIRASIEAENEYQERVARINHAMNI